jgi:hypothetical protein
MYYFSSVIVALVFGLLGFFLHSHFFGKSGETAPSDEIETLKKALEEKSRELRESRGEIDKAGTLARSLEEQIRQRDEEMGALREMVAHQDEEIRQLQKDALMLRAAVGVSDDHLEGGRPDRTVVQDRTKPTISSEGSEPGKEGGPPHGRGVMGAEANRDALAPGWKENLNNILRILDSMKKEIDK